MADTIVITKTQEDVVLVNNGGIEYTLDPRYRVQKKDGNVQILTDLGGLIETFDPAEVEKVVLKDTSEVLIPDQDTLFTQLITNFFFDKVGDGDGLATKSQKKTSTDFTGNPKKTTVDFVTDYGFTAFDDANYSVSVIGVSDGRIWSVESIAAGSFVMNSNSNSGISGDVLWIATKHGES